MTAWALPQLFRALEAGHPSHRGRVVRALGLAGPDALTAEPARATLRRLLAGEDLDLVKRTGDLVSRLGLGVYAPDLVALLARDAERRAAAEAWLRREALARPVDDLVALARDDEAPLAGREAALGLLRDVPLDRGVRVALLPVLGEAALLGPARAVLEPAADEALVSAAVEANRRFGERLLRRRHEARTGALEPGWWARRAWGKPSSLGVWPGLAQDQAAFVRAIAHLAIAAGARRWLEALVPDLFLEGLTGPLSEAWLAHGLTSVAAPLAALPAAWTPRARAARTIELLGRLGATAERTRLRTWLPPFGEAADAAGRAAILALARLGDRERVAPFVEGALAGVLQVLGRPPGGTPGHRSTWGAALHAGAFLGDERTADLTLQVLLGQRPVEEVEAAAPDVFAAHQPLELEAGLERLLAGRPEQVRPPARRAAVRTVGRAGFGQLLGHVGVAVTHAPELAAEAAGVLTELLAAGGGAAAAELLAGGDPGDAALRRLLERAAEVLAPSERLTVARAVLERGRGGARAQRQALELLASDPDPARYRRACVGLFASPFPGVRAAALAAAAGQGLLTAPGDDEVAAVLRLAADALEAHEAEAGARRQVTLLLDASLPAEGVSGVVGAEEARDLRRRLRHAGGWQEAATFHGLHRELLDLQARGLDAGPIHGGLLELLGRRRFLDAATHQVGPYRGPLPRFEEAFAHPSPFVQEALFDLVRGPGYLRTVGLVVRFLASPRPRVRREVLAPALLDREACLAHAERVVAALRDPDPAARRAAVGLLAAHELGRFGADLRPLLDDPDEATRLAAARTLAAWEDPGCLERLAAFLASDDAERRREAVAALRRFDPDRLGGLLAPQVDLERPLAAAAALAVLRPERLPDDEPLRGAVFQVAARGRGPLRARALRFLPAVAGGARLAECVPLLTDAEPRVRAAAADALRRRDGRRHAAAVAALAARTPDAERRLELLDLLADLGVAEAARGLVPLLLDGDGRVRAAAAAAVAEVRGFSLQPELEALLREGLERSAPPEALAELVLLLDRTGDDEVAAVVAEALRCEERGVWEAALSVLRVRGSDVHAGRLGELLEARPPLAPPLQTLVLGELLRLGRADGHGARLEALAREAEAETVRRKALEVLAASGAVDADALAAEVAQAAAERVRGLEAELERQEAAARERRLTARDVQAGTRAARVRVQATAVAAARASIAGADSGEELAARVEALPAEALRGTAPRRAADRAGELLLAGAAPAAIGRAADRAGAARWGVAARLRDRVAAHRFLELAEALVPAAERRTRELLAARCLAARPLPLDALQRELELGERPAVEDLERFVLSALTWWKDELRSLFVPAVRGGRRQADAWPDDRWGMKALRVQPLGERYAEVVLRADLRVGHEELLPLLTDESSARRFRAAVGDVAGLAAELTELHGESKRGARAEVLLLLGEAGGPDAAAAIAEAAARDPARDVRVTAAMALGRVGRPGEPAPPAVREALARLLAEGDAPDAAAVLRAVGEAGLREEAAAVLAGLGREEREVVLAACEAARRLELGAAREGLGHLLVAADGGLRRAAAAAFEPLAGPEDAPALVLGLRKQDDLAVADVLARALIRVCPDDQLDRVGAVLGEERAAAVAGALAVIAAREHRPAAPAVRDLLEGHGEAAVRAAAARAAGALGGDELRAALAARLDPKVEGHEAARAAAVAAAARLAPDAEAGRALLLERLEAERSPTVQAAAVEALGGLPDPAGEVAARLLRLVRDLLYPELRLLEPGEPAPLLAARVEADRPRLLAPDRQRLLVAACAALVRLDGDGDPAAEPWRPAAQAQVLVWGPLEPGWGDARHLTALDPWLEAATGDAARAAVDRLLALGRGHLADAALRLAALERAVARDPARAAPAVVVAAQGPAAWGAHWPRLVVRAAGRALRAGHDAWRGELRACLLDPRAEVRRAARAWLEPGRWGDPDEEGAA